VLNSKSNSINRPFRGSEFRILYRALCFLLVSILLAACASSTAYQAYPGPARPASQVAVLVGQQYLRNDWLNRYVDAVRFSHVDGEPIERSQNYSRVEITPGEHSVTVYFYWDMGSQRGLAPALVQYASSRQTLSRTLSFQTRPGVQYTVMAEPVFTEAGQRDITNLAYVDFWVMDERGNQVLDREHGRYIPMPQ